MSGPTAQQNELSAEQTQAYQQAMQMTQEEYANQQSIYAPMTAQFQSIFAKGPSQEGFSQAEKTDLDSQALEGTAENYSNAAKATDEALASEGGGTNPLTTGAQAQMKANVAQSAAQEEGKEENQIDQADYAQGQANWQSAAGGLEAIASGENPLGYEQAETGAGSAASTTADNIAQEEDSWENAAIGAVGTAAGGWAEGGFKK